jgi:prepilin-type N-terminal cleavage/methylation domain-containing protein
MTMKQVLNDECPTLNESPGRPRRAHSLHSSFIPHPSSFSSRAFTLIELLVVIGILVLMLLIALPAVNFITGSRSAESATNVIGALLGSARAQAIARQSNVGVIFYWDKNKEQTVAGICSTAQPWDGTTSYVGGDVVQDPNGRYYFCNFPIVGGGNPASNTTSWAVANGYAADMPVLLDGFDVQTLPKGVGLQGVRNTVNAAGPPTDRYITTACVMFDGEGRLSFTNYGLFLGISAPSNNPPINYSRLGASLQMFLANGNPVYNIPSNVLLSCQAGFAVYDHQTFKDAGYDERHFVTGELTQYSTNQPGDEKSAETWIDNNSTFLLINRYNGTLLKSE